MLTPAFVAVPTRDGTRRVQRLAQSVRGLPLVVFDSSERPQPEIAGVLRLDRPALLRWAERLGTRAACPRAAHLAFGLAGTEPWTVGGTRNAALLIGAGHAFLSLDDDVIPHGRPPSGGPPVPARGDPTRWVGFGDPEVAARALDPIPLDLTSLTPDLGAALPEGRACLVRLGFAGHAGWSSILPMLQARGASLRDLAPDDARFVAVVTRGGVSRGAAAPAWGRPPFFMSMAFAVDHREMLPPFPPHGRAGDSAFGALCAACVADHGIVWSDAAVLHLPDPPRVTTVEAMIRAARGLRFADLVTDLAWRARVGSDPAGALADVAASLRELATSRAGPFLARVVGVQRRVHAAHRARLAAPHPGWRPPAAWIAARDATDRLLADTAEVLDPWWSARGAPACAELAEVLESWPMLWEAARDADPPLDRVRRLVGT